MDSLRTEFHDIHQAHYGESQESIGNGGWLLNTFNLPFKW